MMGTGEVLLAIVGLLGLTIVTRGFFFLSRREVPFPAWLRQGLRYAPLAALAAVVVPEIVMQHGQVNVTWHDARLYAAAWPARCTFGGDATFWAPSSRAWPCFCRCGWAWAGEPSLESTFTQTSGNTS
jgi:branched-subunit amino acid transport protein